MKRPDEKSLAKQREGHRDRVRRRFAEGGIGVLQSYEILEYLLFLLMPRRDVKPIAKSLIEHFNGIANVLDADVEELVKFGFTERMAIDMTFLRQLTTLLRFEKVSDRPFLETSEEAVLFLQAKIGSSRKETLMVFYLDAGRRIVSTWEHQGTVNSAAVAPREVVERALLCHAVGVILVHNHPSGSCKPSAADVGFTQTIYNALDLFGIKLLDHLIVTKDSYRSLLK